MRILVVEDSVRLRQSLTDGLRESGYAVDGVSDGREGLIHARTTDYDLIVLDIMLPEIDGLSMLRQYREARGATPVLILSARDRVEQRIEGLRLGADDYLVKPFSFDELLARIEALCRRGKGIAETTVRIGSLVLDLSAKRFSISGAEVPLAPREFAILEFLFVSAGRTVSRSEIEEHIYAENKQVWSNAVDSAIASIRRKLTALGVRDLIRTRRGRGYLVEQPVAASGDHT